MGRAVRGGDGDPVACLDREGKWSHKGRFYKIEEMEVRPLTGAESRSPMGVVLEAVDGTHREERPEYDLRAACGGDGVGRAGAPERLSRPCIRSSSGHMRSAMCSSSSIHLTTEEEDYGRESHLRFSRSVGHGVPFGLGESAADLQILPRDRGHSGQHEEGRAERQIDPARDRQQIIDSLKRGRGRRHGGGDLLFQRRLKPHAMVKEQMERFMAKSRRTSKSGGAYSVCCNYRLFHGAGDAARATRP